MPPALLLLGPGLSLKREHAQQHSTKRAEPYRAKKEQAQQQMVHSPGDGNYEYRQGYKSHLHGAMHRTNQDCRLPLNFDVQALHVNLT